MKREFRSPVGRLMLVAEGAKLRMCDWVEGQHFERNVRMLDRKESPAIIDRDQEVLAQAEMQLTEYFAGTRREFNLPIRMKGTEFQLSVWRALQQIPYGNTLSYGELARRIGRPRSVRAVANAVGRNPLSIVVPCHRIIGSNGALTGYAGQLLEAKRYLLALERGNIGF